MLSDMYKWHTGDEPQYYHESSGARQYFRVHLVGYIGGSYDGDIAIDDIEFLNCVGCKLLTIYLFHKPEQIAFDFLKNNFLKPFFKGKNFAVE